MANTQAIVLRMLFVTRGEQLKQIEIKAIVNRPYK